MFKSSIVFFSLLLMQSSLLCMNKNAEMAVTAGVVIAQGVGGAKNAVRTATGAVGKKKMKL